MTDPLSLPPEAQQLLEKMHGISEPGPISWWPLAPGWWVLMIVGVALIGFGVYWTVSRVRRNRYRKVALRLLTSVAAQPNRYAITDLNEIIKRTALHAYPQERAEIARSYGSHWVQWLNSKCKKPVVNDQTAQEFALGGYRPDGGVLSSSLIEAARGWIIHHRPPKPGQRSHHA